MTAQSTCDRLDLLRGGGYRTQDFVRDMPRQTNLVQD